MSDTKYTSINIQKESLLATSLINIFTYLFHPVQCVLDKILDLLFISWFFWIFKNFGKHDVKEEDGKPSKYT